MGKKSLWDKAKAAVGAPVNAVKVATQGGSISDVMRAGGQASAGGQVLGDALGGKNLASKIAQGDLGGAVQASKSHAADKAKAAQDEMKSKEEEQYGQNQDFSKQLGEEDTAYLNRMKGNVNAYQDDLNQLRRDTQGAQTDARQTYSNIIQPRMKDLMTQAQVNSRDAMSLKEAQDPNNAVAKATRKFYEDQAQGEGRQNLADTGVLQALGAQNLAGQLGNVPMTGGQLQALMGANMAQAGNAYQRGTQRTQDLRDRGLEQGFARSDVAYARGLGAQDRYRQSIGDYEGVADRQQARDAGFRSQLGGLSGQTYGLQQQMADAARGAGQAATNRDMAIYNTHMGGQQAQVAGQIQQLNAQEAQRGQMITGGLQAAGTVAGAYFGGPAGAAAGGQVGQQIGQANAPQQAAVPQVGNYAGGPATASPSLAQQNANITAYRMDQMAADNRSPYNYGGNGVAAQMGPPASASGYTVSGNGAQMGPPAPQGLGLTQRMARR